jgi:hypothetical protein
MNWNDISELPPEFEFVLRKSIEMAVREEREACAKIADAMNENCPICDGRYIAAAIRARGEQK